MRIIRFLLAFALASIGMIGWAGAELGWAQSCTPLLNISCSFIAHNDIIGTLIFSPDGKLMATASSDQSVVLWDVATGAKLKTLLGHRGEVWAAAFSPDGKVLATGSYDRTIILWDVVTGNELKVLKGHDEFVRALAFSPDGSILASSSWDHTIKLWSMPSGRLMRTLEGHTDWVVSISFSPDGKRLASSSDDYSVRVWDVMTGAQLHEMDGHTGNIWSVSFSPDGEIIASASEDRTIRIWNASNGMLMHVMTGHTKEIRSIAFSKDGKLLASGARDGSVILWNPIQGKEVKVLHTDPESDIWTVAFTPDGQQIASGACTKRNSNNCRQGEVRYDPIGESAPVGALNLSQFDRNGDKILEDSEFFAVVDAWVAGKIENSLFFAAVDDWVSSRQIQVAAMSSLATRQYSEVTLIESGRNFIRFAAHATEANSLRIEIYSLAGERLYTQSAPGNHLTWRLLDDHDRPVANGTYLYALTWQRANGMIGFGGIKKLILLR
jgi:WD40 repeat protein